MKVTIEELEAYLLDHYSNGGIDQSLFMKLVEEIGEVAEVLNKKAGRKKSGSEDLQAQLGNELADVIHYAIAIAALNDLDMNQIIIEKESYRAFRKRLRYGFARIYLSYLTRTQRIMIDVDIIYRSGAWMR